MSEHDELHPEAPFLDERLITAPRAGVFHPFLTELPVTDVGRVVAGEPIGVLVHSGEKSMVESPFEGVFRGLLVLPGERVREGQPVAWVTLVSSLGVAVAPRARQARRLNGPPVPPARPRKRPRNPARR